VKRVRRIVAASMRLLQGLHLRLVPEAFSAWLLASHANAEKAAEWKYGLESWRLYRCRNFSSNRSVPIVERRRQLNIEIRTSVTKGGWNRLGKTAGFG
jgi:hypothetical protein